MSLSQNRTGELWRSAIPQLKAIPNRLTSDFISMQVYAPGYYTHFHPDNEFEKWACVEVAGFEHIPHGMQTFLLEGGTYAVFHYKGSSADPRIFQYIFTQWLPQSEYQLDDRPHFEVLGEKYRNNHPDSEEEIWIPVK